MVAPPATGGTTASAGPRPSLGDSTTLALLKGKAAPGTLNGPPSGNNHAIPLSARRAEALDLKTVERRGQQNGPTEKANKSRMFGIPNAPVFRPTDEEWRDPMEYMRKIEPEGSKYGIVKITPPDSWNPPFAINTERFHFRTRRQELNSVEGGNRVENDYLDQLAKFHKQNGHNLNRFPSVDKRPLDLYRLKKTVERKGGFEAVGKSKRWAEVGRDLGYSGKIMSSLSTSLKNSYQKWLLPYEDYLRVAKPGVQQQLEMLNGGPYTPSPGPSPVKKSNANTPQGHEHTPTMQASAALHASVNGHPASAPSPAQSLQQPSPANLPSVASGGFTPVNPGGFTPVNAPHSTPSFTAVNGANGFHASNSTPNRQPETSAANPGALPIAPHTNTSMGALKRHNSELSADELELEGRRSKRLRKDIPTVAGSNMHHYRTPTARFQSARDQGTFKPGENCESCGKPDEPHKRLQCESCGCAYHMYCLEPQVKQQPDYEWHCPRCLVGTNEYGFEDGDVYSLAGFQKRANDFKTSHFINIPSEFSPYRHEKAVLDEDDIEREFWRLVEDPSATIEVEYGADIHSTTHGSGFPTIEKHPRDPYSTDPWNLNILPLDKESLFRHIKSDVSGMTVPWLYVGMVFSTFCWHNEDHFTYSANYQHFGDTKTWYGIPAEDSYKFELAMRSEVPELFETQPDLLFQLVTLARPDKLRKAGVRVYAIDQHAGQFVITFPRAYHAGFNHGFNFNEAVNFAPQDWEPFGEEGVKRLRDYRKQPCFSHDELLLTAASRDHTIRTARWLGPALERMRQEELEVRAQFLKGPDAEAGTAHAEPYTGPRYPAHSVIVDSDTEEDETICVFCKAYCYLSRFVCNKTGKFLCLLHAGSYECCDVPEHDRYTGHNSEHVLVFRMTDNVLNTTVRKVVDKANLPEVWAAKVDSELDENPRPSLKHLRTLLAEGEKIQWELPQLFELRRFVDRCNEWVEDATAYITRKQTNRRKNEKVWRKGSVKAAEQEERDRELRNVAKIQDLLASADKIGFDCAEITTLRERAESIAEFQRDATEALSAIFDRTTADFEDLVQRGKDFHVDIPEIDSLERVLRRLKWNDMAKQKRPNPETGKQEATLNDIDEFIHQGLGIGVPETNQDLVYFREHMTQGQMWEQKAKEVMAAEQPNYQQLDALSKQADTLPVTKSTYSEVEAILKKQRELADKIVSLLDRSRDPEFRNRAHYSEMKGVMEELEALQSKPPGTLDLEREMKKHEDWMRRGKKLFGKANAPLHILHQHMEIVDRRNEFCLDLMDKPRGPVEPSSRAPTPDEYTGVDEDRDVFCICRRPEAGMMIECELCHEWYHGKCLKIARGKVKEDDKYTCPICDWRVKIPRDAARPKLEDLQAWQEEMEMLPFQPDEEDVLNNICHYGQAFRDFIKPYVEPIMPTTSDEVSVLRFYLRKIEGADILLAPETNYLRTTLHQFAPVAPVAPPVIDESNSTRKPRPTKQQKLMAQLGITNPEDIPQQYKLKTHNGRRKASQPKPLVPLGEVEPTFSSANVNELASKTEQGQSKSSKKHLTALALHVLGPLAGAPVVDQFLAWEPHANREKLLKVKAVLLEDNPDIVHDLSRFKAAVNAQTIPAAYGPRENDERPEISAEPPERLSDTPGFAHASNFSHPASASPPRRLASSGQPTPQQYGSPPATQRYGSPPVAQRYPSPQAAQSTPYLFDTHRSSSMFETPSNAVHGTGKDTDSVMAASTSPDFGGDIGGGGGNGSAQTGSMIPSGMPPGMFDSPRPLGSSSGADHRHSHSNASSSALMLSGGGAAANIDSVFADLVHDDHDALGSLDGAGDLRGRGTEDAQPDMDMQDHD